jgi:hypothetical protein
MNTDEKWHRLLARSTPTFDAQPTPPYGFVTSALAQLRVVNRPQEEAERIGWRALLLSLAALAMAAVVTVTVNFSEGSGSDLDPGVKTMVQVENFPVS